MIEEQWKDIEGYEGLYQISNLGRVKSLKFRKDGKVGIVRPYINRGGYLRVNLWRNYQSDRRLVHRLVAEAFVPNPDNKQYVNHINEIKIDNRAENLNWMTAKENNNWGTHNERMRETKRGKVTWMKGKHHSEESRKRLSDAILGRKWYNNGIEEKQIKGNPPEGWNAGRLSKTHAV